VSGRVPPQSSARLSDDVRFRTIFEQSPVSTQIFAPDGTTLSVNGAWERLWGVKLEQIGPYNILQDHQLVDKGAMPYIVRAFSGEATAIPPIQYEPDKTIPDTGAVAFRWTRAYIYPVLDENGGIQEVVLMHEDITQETLARQEIERLAAERAATLSQITDGIIISDPEGRLTFVNEAARRIHGLAEIGVGVDRYTSSYNLFTMEGDPYPPHDLPLARAVERRESVTDALWRVRPPDGPEVVAQGSAAPIWADDGRFLGAVLSLRDITATYMMERQKDEFLSAIAHDLRTPLTAIKGRVQLLLRRLEDLTPQETRVLAEVPLERGLSAIGRSAAKMATLITELLDVANSELGRAAWLERQEVDLVALVRKIAKNQEDMTSDRQIRIESTVPELVGSFDPARLTRVFANLISNALKYSSPDSNVEIRIERDEQPDGSYARIAVADSGPGILSADLPHIFEQFRRGSNVIGRTSGLGIGLAVVRDTVRHHGGHVQVQSQEGKGTTVVVTLPLYPDTPA
jgi:PAS domain S-box-containing protein